MSSFDFIVDSAVGVVVVLLSSVCSRFVTRMRPYLGFCDCFCGYFCRCYCTAVDASTIAVDDVAFGIIVAHGFVFVPLVAAGVIIAMFCYCSFCCFVIVRIGAVMSCNYSPTVLLVC